MISKTLTLNDPDFPDSLRLLDKPPTQLYVRGPLTDLLASPLLAVVGSRKVSAYGRDVATRLVGDAVSTE